MGGVLSTPPEEESSTETGDELITTPFPRDPAGEKVEKIRSKVEASKKGGVG